MSPPLVTLQQTYRSHPYFLSALLNTQLPWSRVWANPTACRFSPAQLLASISFRHTPQTAGPAQTVAPVVSTADIVHDRPRH